MLIANAHGLQSNLELTLPIVVLVLILLFVWDDIARSLQRRLDEDAVAAEFDEETTLEEWLDCFPERHLFLLDRPEAK